MIKPGAKWHQPASTCYDVGAILLRFWLRWRINRYTCMARAITRHGPTPTRQRHPRHSWWLVPSHIIAPQHHYNTATRSVFRERCLVFTSAGGTLWMWIVIKVYMTAFM